MQIITKKSFLMYQADPVRYHRIPGIVVTARGTILLYWEMRSGASDWLCDGIGLLRSEDCGETWSEIRTIAVSHDSSPLNNPVMIACRDGRVIFLWEEAYCRGYVSVSTDDGISFSSASEITENIKSFRANTGYQWDVFAFGPGHGTELSDGRLIVPVWFANGGPHAHMPSVVSTAVSSDGGKTWKTGELIGDRKEFVNPNETCLFQKENGDVVLNIRHTGKTHYRAVSVSRDGLRSFSEPVFDRQLPDPVCFGSAVKSPVPFHGAKPVLFSNCATMPCPENHYSRRRENLSLRLSLDDGKTWAYTRQLENYGGYSDVAFSPDGQWIYCFYEQDIDSLRYTEPRYLTFARLNFNWLIDTP